MGKEKPRPDNERLLNNPYSGQSNLEETETRYLTLGLDVGVVAGELVVAVELQIVGHLVVRRIIDAGDAGRRPRDARRLPLHRLLRRLLEKTFKKKLSFFIEKKTSSFRYN